MRRATRDSESVNPNQGETAPESRRYARKAFNHPLEFELTDGRRRPGVCTNISLGGLHVDTAEPAPFDASVIIFVQLPGIEGITALPGIVRWTRPDSMGVQLGLLGARVTNAIVRLLTES